MIYLGAQEQFLGVRIARTGAHLAVGPGAHLHLVSGVHLPTGLVYEVRQRGALLLRERAGAGRERGQREEGRAVAGQQRGAALLIPADEVLRVPWAVESLSADLHRHLLKDIYGYSCDLVRTNLGRHLMTLRPVDTVEP